MKQIATFVEFLDLFVIFSLAPDTLMGVSGVQFTLYKHIRVSATNWSRILRQYNDIIGFTWIMAYLQAGSILK